MRMKEKTKRYRRALSIELQVRVRILYCRAGERQIPIVLLSNWSESIGLPSPVSYHERSELRAAV